MQNIQDKEFDQLFRDRFEGAETEPSANLWENIETQLENKPKRVFSVYWIAAALCAAALTAGLLFRQPENRQAIKLVSAWQTAGHRSANKTVSPDDRIVKEKPSETEVRVLSVTGSSSPASQPSASGRSSLPGAAVHAASVITNTAAVAGENGTKKDLTAMQPLALIVHPEYSAISVKQKKEKLPEPAKETPEEIMLASAEVSPAVKQEGAAEEDEPREKHRGIRNIGDLVNYVVNKVDKREEKFLKFKTEDDDSSLIGINIGMIRFNRRDKNDR
ncbi:MAG TPA: hypothetical protein VGC08_05390 [Pedobacter sp.]